MKTRGFRFLNPGFRNLRKKKLGKEDKGCSLLKIGAEICEGDEHRRFQFSQSGSSLNGRNLFTELPFL